MKKSTLRRTWPAARGPLCWLIAAMAAGPALAENIAPLGTGIIGVNDDADSDAGTPRANAGVPGNVNDGNPETRVDTWFGGNPDPFSYVGVVWPARRFELIHQVAVRLATFTDGGWFGVPGATPLPGQPLEGGFDLVEEPIVQITTDGGTTWTTVDATSDYFEALTGHTIGGGGNPNPTAATVTFNLTTPATEINGIRVIGQNGGVAGADDNGFLGVFEFYVEASPSPDSDNDGMADSWETAYGLNVGVDDSAGDADSDGLTNLEEFQAETDPTKADTDGDGLTDAAEVKTHNTNPLVADTDGDGLSDGDEVNEHNTNPLLADTDGDGLSDGAEVNTHGTNPLRRDSDADSYTDAEEISQGSDPNDPTDYPANIAPFGVGIIGVNDAIDDDIGQSRPHAGAASNVNDGNLDTRSDTWWGDGDTDMGQIYSYVGVIWEEPRPMAVLSLRLELATFFDGGWFGVSGYGPGAGMPLTSDILIEPTVQISTNRGTNWTTVAHTSDYLTALDGHGVGGGANPNPSRAIATFTLNEPARDITGIRIIGENGGLAGADANGFLGVFELVVNAGLDPASDTDSDGMADSWETEHGLNVGTNDAMEDPDNDGLSNIQEFAGGTNPKNPDTDGDGLTDGEEVIEHGTDATEADTDGDGLTDGFEVNTSHTDPLDADSDDDGLTDGAEVNEHHTNPLEVDSDGDGFPDAIEVRLGSNPNLQVSVPANIASQGLGILGVNDAVDADLGTLVFNAGVRENINDANPATRVDSFSSAGTVSFVGILWDEPPANPIVSLELSLAVFFDGGWFGPNGFGPGTGNALTPEYLIEPTVQVTTDGGTTWTNVEHESDYLDVMDGHLLPDVDFGPPTLAKATFTLTAPQTGINGIRIIGEEGGTATGGFLGVFELAVNQQVASGSLVAASIEAASGNVTLTWNSEPGTSYQVEQSDDLVTWTTAQDNIAAAPAPATTTSITLNNQTAAARFYRIEVLP